MAQIQDPNDLPSFHRLVAAETERLESKCRKWSTFMKEHAAATNGTDQVDNADKENATATDATQPDANGNGLQLELTEDDLGRIRTTVGQAQLLMKERFGQFTKLVDQAINKTSKLPIHGMDLMGFWEMVAIQVEDVDRKFAALDPLASKTQPGGDSGSTQSQPALASRTPNKT